MVIECHKVECLDTQEECQEMARGFLLEVDMECHQVLSMHPCLKTPVAILLEALACQAVSPQYQICLLHILVLCQLPVECQVCHLACRPDTHDSLGLKVWKVNQECLTECQSLGIQVPILVTQEAKCILECRVKQECRVTLVR